MSAMAPRFWTTAEDRILRTYYPIEGTTVLG